MAEDDDDTADGNGGDQSAPRAQAHVARIGGLNLAALIVGISTVLLAAVAWAVWLSAGVSVPASDLGWSPYATPAPAPVPTPAPTQAIVPLGGAGLLVGLAAGAVWCAMLPASTVGLVLARLAARQTDDRASPRSARAATVTAVLALLLALAGTALFCLTLQSAAAGMPTIYRFAG